MSLFSFTDAIHEATKSAMADNRNIHVLGLGASYRNGLDGTMGTLATEYPGRVHDTPCSEAAVTGAAVGMATSGLHPRVHHGRIEFALYALDGILTQAAKWDYMFGGNYPCPLTVRIAMGRQWGNGPQHTFTSKGIFAVPGLNVVCPSTPSMAYDLLYKALETQSPVIYLESRWLYKTKETFNLNMEAQHYPVSLTRACIRRKGTDVTIVAIADMVLESLRAAKMLASVGISAEVIDIVSINPIDHFTIQQSAIKTKRLFAVDASTPAFSVAHEILTDTPLGRSITCLDMACATAPSLMREYYPTAMEIAHQVSVSCGDAFKFTKADAQELLAPTDNFDDLLL